MSNWKNLTSRLLTNCVNAFGTEATYSPKEGDDFDIEGIFDRPNLNIELGQDNSHQSSAPTFGVKLSDMETDPVDGDSLTIDGKTFTVFEVQKDGQGHAKLLLHEED